MDDGIQKTLLYSNHVTNIITVALLVAEKPA